VVDQSGFVPVREPYSKAGLAVEVAAVLALAAARHSDRVGALMFADKVEYVVRPPQRPSPRAARDPRSDCLHPPGARHQSRRGAALRHEAAAHRAIVVVMSDFSR